MEILSEEFKNEIRAMIVDMVSDATEHFMEEKNGETRYLQQKQARTYLGGIGADDFKKLVAQGMPEIRIGNRVRYDKKALDQYMAKHQI